MKLADKKKDLALKMLGKLDKKHKEHVYKGVDKHFRKQFHYAAEIPRHDKFKKKYPYDAKNTPIGELKGKAKAYHDKLFQESQAKIDPEMSKLEFSQAKKEVSKHYKSPNRQRGGIKGFLKTH